LVPADPRHSQTYITLTPIVIRKTDNEFTINNEYDSQIMISPISQTVRGDNLLDYEYVQLYFSNTEINIMVRPQTIWDALRDIGGLLSLMLFFASFASMRHIYQFNDSLRKSFQRASRAFRRHKRCLAASAPTRRLTSLRARGQSHRRCVNLRGLLPSGAGLGQGTHDQHPG
jgi:hypothetical protein